jgi:hypothetical protein
MNSRTDGQLTLRLKNVSSYTLNYSNRDTFLSFFHFSYQIVMWIEIPFLRWISVIGITY